MASSDQSTPGTIAEYDIVLSLSEEAINRQFQLLYDKTIDGPAMNPPPGMETEGVASPVPSKYLINHHLEIHIAHAMGAGKKPKIDYDEGIFGHIKSPRVSFRDSGTENKGRVVFEFQRDESVVDVKKQDSLFAQWVGIGRSAEIEKTNINGWTMSWDVKLGQSNIQNIMTELIEPADNKNDPSVLHPGAVKALTPLANKNFTVSAIFCIFEAAQIVSNFKLFDADGKPPPDAHIADFASKVATYFSLLQSKVPDGRATPDNPFVLGYGLYQDLPDIKAIQPGIDAENTPVFLIPKSYHLTVTPSGSKFTGGSVNFCILTHREKDDKLTRDANRTDPTKNLNAGRLEQTFFDLTRTLEQDGIMAIARDLVFDRFLCREVANSFFIDIQAIFKKAMSAGTSDQGSLMTVESNVKTSDQPPTFRQKQALTYKGKVDRLIKDDKQSVTGYSQLDASWTSSLQTDPNVEEKDAVRKARLTFTSQIVEDYEFTNTGFVFDDILYAHVDMMYKYVLDLSPGKGGLIDIVKIDDACSLPDYLPNGKLKLIETSRPAGAYGAYYTTTKKDSPFTLVLSDLLKYLPESYKAALQLSLKTVEDKWAESIADTAIAEYENRWKAGITSVKNKVILPAGNVFSFSGVDIDTKGNLYTHISFSRGTEGVKVKTSSEADGTTNVAHGN